jgi:death-on-curing protein
MAESSWYWLRTEFVKVLHKRVVSRSGGSHGIRDEGLLESALSRPQQKAYYGSPTVYELAAAYAYGLVSNHPFVDGNKRIGLATALACLSMHDLLVDLDDDETVDLMLAVASGAKGEEDLAAYFEKHSKPKP